MQLSKVLLVLGAASVCLTPLPGRSADKASVAPLLAPTPASPEAVEKARAAMRQKMEELQNADPAATKPAPAQPAPAAAAPTVPVVPAPAPVQAVTPPAPAPAAVMAAPSRASIQPADPAAIEKARAAMRQKIAELNEQPSQPAPAPKAQQAKAPSKKQQAKAQADAQADAAKVAPSRLQSSQPAQVALTKEEPSKAQPEAPKPVKEAKAKEAKKQTKATKAPEPVVTQMVAKQGFEPLSGPPSPLSADKQQRLSELLTKYKADQVTPEQYHSERARILAEP